MKTFYSIFIAVIAMMTTTTVFSQVKVTETENEIIATIDAETSRLDLIQMHEGLLEKGIDFRYDPQFDEERRVVRIDFTVEKMGTESSVHGVHESLQTLGSYVIFRVSKKSDDISLEIH